jgi:hypothetical protein
VDSPVSGGTLAGWQAGTHGSIAARLDEDHPCSPEPRPVGDLYGRDRRGPGQWINRIGNLGSTVTMLPGKPPLQLDVPELINRSGLSQNPTAKMCVAKERGEPPRQSAGGPET